MPTITPTRSRYRGPIDLYDHGKFIGTIPAMPEFKNPHDAFKSGMKELRDTGLYDRKCKVDGKIHEGKLHFWLAVALIWHGFNNKQINMAIRYGNHTARRYGVEHINKVIKSARDFALNSLS